MTPTGAVQVATPRSGSCQGQGVPSIGLQKVARPSTHGPGPAACSTLACVHHAMLKLLLTSEHVTVGLLDNASHSCRGTMHCAAVLTSCATSSMRILQWHTVNPFKASLHIGVMERLSQSSTEYGAYLTILSVVLLCKPSLYERYRVILLASHLIGQAPATPAEKRSYARQRAAGCLTGHHKQLRIRPALAPAGLSMPFSIFMHLMDTGVDDLFYQATLHLCLIPLMDLPVSATVLGAALLTPMYLALNWHSLQRQGLAPHSWGLLMLGRQAACCVAGVGGATLVHALVLEGFGSGSAGEPTMSTIVSTSASSSSYVRAGPGSCQPGVSARQLPGRRSGSVPPRRSAAEAGVLPPPCQALPVRPGPHLAAGAAFIRQAAAYYWGGSKPNRTGSWRLMHAWGAAMLACTAVGKSAGKSAGCV
ncbi:hypothetical protein HaLaN_08129 [Haematococcus lacustris]|uniref:Uncharacterized protein n=1 Tax=Haematococcus lacustris TaxID=44745 RepID=A0A699YQ54_HAELA|nr:hypothetical protein HaLaN_08129 [Haematococcus lacustris]